jgi:hypothetical protein
LCRRDNAVKDSVGRHFPGELIVVDRIRLRMAIGEWRVPERVPRSLISSCLLSSPLLSRRRLPFFFTHPTRAIHCCAFWALCPQVNTRPPSGSPPPSLVSTNEWGESSEVSCQPLFAMSLSECLSQRSQKSRGPPRLHNWNDCRWTFRWTRLLFSTVAQ